MKTVGEILATDYPDESIIAGGVLSVGDVMLWHGAPKIGKTYLAIQSMWELTHGKPWMATFEVVRPQRIGYYQVEISEGLFKRRLLPFQWTYSDRLFIESDKIFKLNEAGRDQVLHDIDSFKLDGIGFDPFYRIHIGGENEKQDLEPTLDFISSITLSQRVWVWLIHHDRKVGIDKNGNIIYTGSQEARGHSSLIGYPDALVGLVGHKAELGKPRSAGLRVAFEFRNSEPHDPIELIMPSASTGRWFLPTMQGERVVTCVLAEVKLKGGEIEHGELARIMETEYLVKDDGLRAALVSLQENNRIKEVGDKTDGRKKQWRLK